MALQPGEFARRDGATVEHRNQPVRIAWSFTNLLTQDSHALECGFSCSMRIADNAIDRRMFAEVLLSGRDSATVEQIAGHFNAVLRNCFESQFSQFTAADAVEREHQKWTDALMQSAQPIAFACGLEILPPFAIDLRSDSLRRERMSENSSLQLQKAFGRAAAVLEQFQTLRQSAPQLSPGQILQQLSPQDRGQSLQSLLMASANQSKAKRLWAVAGPSLVEITFNDSSPERQIHPLPLDLGPLRSVQTVNLEESHLLLIGAQKGVLVVNPDDLAYARRYMHPDVDSPLGFNRVIWHNEQIVASHTEAGIVGWEINTLAPQMAHSDRMMDMGPRFLQSLNASTLVYAIGSKIILRDQTRRRELPSLIDSSVDALIVGIVACPRVVVIVREHGILEMLDRDSEKLIETRRRSDRICAAGALPWLGDVRLLLATESGSINCVGLDDQVVTEYCGPYRGVKMVCGSSDLVAAISPDRQRIVLWRSWDGQKPMVEIHITAQTRHRVADIEFDI